MSSIITFARNRIAYTLAKSLAKHGVTVTTSDSVYPAMTFFSKYSSSFFTYPSYTRNPEGFVRCLFDHVKARKPDVLMPAHEETVILSYFKDRFAKYTKLPIASYEQMNVARDKTTMTALAQRLDVPTPPTYHVRGLQELPRIGDDVAYPAVIKIPRGRGAWGLTYVHTKNDLLAAYTATLQRFGKGSGVPFIQEYIPGTGYGVSALFNQGEVRALFVHKRLMEYPLTGGASVERISTRHVKMEEYACRLLTHLKWHGVAMVEFKLDRRTGTPVFLEINPRFWGSLNQAVCAGVDFPRLLYEMAVSGDVSPTFNYRVGVRTRWFFGQIQALLDAVKRGQGIQALTRFNLFARNTYYDDFSVTDIMPFLVAPLPYLVHFLQEGALDTYESIDDAVESLMTGENDEPL
jgi:predicted ATP-grasp superfamily ATP-dependent carboligase